MAPLAEVIVEGRLRFCHEKVMKKFHDVFGHPHELIIRRGWGRALRHKVANGLCGIAQTEREHCRGTPDEVFQGEQLSSGKLHHDVGEGEGEVAHILPGRSGSQEGVELALQPPVVEVEDLAALGGVGLRRSR